MFFTATIAEKNIVQENCETFIGGYILKIGIIRCQQTEDMCPGTTCFHVAKQGKLAFEELGSCEIVGFVTCGGCPGKKSVTRAKTMAERGAEVIVFASCMTKGNPIGFPCPHIQTIKNCIEKRVQYKHLVDWTH